VSGADLEHVVARLAQEVERRFFGKYRGFVVDDDDPEKLGRLKLTVPSVLGEEVVTGWAMPCLPYGGAANRGMLFVPEKESGVWVEFEEGDLEFPIWVGTFWSKPGGDSELPLPNGADGAEEDEVQGPPTRKVIKTAKGHTLQFEDGDGEVRVLIGDGQAENHIVLGSAGITITNKDNVVTMSDGGVVIEDVNGNSVTQDGSGTVIKDANGNEIVMAAGGIQIGGTGATEPFVLGTQFMTEVQSFLVSLSTHTHVGNMGAPTSPPTSPLTLNVPLSSKHKVE
jgi:hypothetical protein